MEYYHKMVVVEWQFTFDHGCMDHFGDGKNTSPSISFRFFLFPPLSEKHASFSVSVFTASFRSLSLPITTHNISVFKQIAASILSVFPRITRVINKPDESLFIHAPRPCLFQNIIHTYSVFHRVSFSLSRKLISDVLQHFRVQTRSTIMFAC